MSPRVNDNATAPSANPIVVKVGLQMAREMDLHTRPVSITTPDKPIRKRPLLERRRNRWSRRSS